MWDTSAGFGTGPAWQAPWGAGPYITFTFTPGYGVGVDEGHLMAVVEHGDFTEQRVHLSRERTLNLRYNIPFVTSGEYASVRSFHGETVGQLGIFLAMDHETQRHHVVRFADPTLSRPIGGVGQGDLAINFKVRAPYPLPALVMEDGPIVYFPLSDLGFGLVGSGWIAESAVNTLAARSYLVTGARTLVVERQVDRTLAFSPASKSYVSCSLAATVLNAIAGGMTFEACFAPTVGSACVGQLVGRQIAAGGWALRVDSGTPTFAYSSANGSINLLGNQVVLDGVNHIMVRKSATAAPTVFLMDMWLNGTLVASQNLTTTDAFWLPNSGTLLIGGEGSNVASATAGRFAGRIAHVAVYSVALSQQRIQQHYAAFVGR